MQLASGEPPASTLHTYIHPYTYVRTYVHPSIPTYVRTCVHTYIQVSYRCVCIDMHTCICIYVYVHVCCLSNLPTSRCVIVGFTKQQELCLQSLDCTTVMVGHGHCWMRRNLVVDSCKSSGKMQLYNAMHQLKK